MKALGFLGRPPIDSVRACKPFQLYLAPFAEVDVAAARRARNISPAFAIAEQANGA